MVTHVTDVRPLVSVVTYTDVESGHEVYQEVTGRTFKPLDNNPAEVRAWMRFNMEVWGWDWGRRGLVTGGAAGLLP